MKLIFIFIFFVTILQGGVREAASLEKVSVQLHWKYQFEFAGFIAAKEKGFYRDAGLDVDLREYQFGTDIVKDVLSQKATYGVYNSNILIDYLKHKNISLLASYFKRSALIIIAKPYIHSPKDLIGKRIMAVGKEDFDLNFKTLFDNYGIDTNRLQFVKHTYNMDDFIHDKNVDAMTAFISDQPYKLDQLGCKYNIINPSDYGTFNLQLELFTSAQEIQTNKERALRFRDATKKGWEYAISHQDEMAVLIHSKYAPNISVDALKHEAKEITKLILPYTYGIGSIDLNFLNRQAEIFRQNYKIDSERDINNFVVYNGDEKYMNFTKDERDYLSKHKKIGICLQYDSFPYDSISNGNYTGIMGDFFQIAHKDLEVEFLPILSKSSQELEQKISRHECEILSLLPSQSRIFPQLNVTKPILTNSFALIGTLDKPFIQDTMLLKDKKIIVQFQAYKEHLETMYPYLNIVVEPDADKIMRVVLKNEVYGAAVTAIKADYIIEKYGYGKLKINGFLATSDPLSLSIGVQKDDETLLNILQKEINNIPKIRMENLVNNWKMKAYKEQIDYTVIIRIIGVLAVIFAMMIYYQRKLKRFNDELSKQVDFKTKELQQINENLEISVQEKIAELVQKDKILTLQSKQAVMGEMIEMIAHQWRQPLSTITLQISNLQIRKMMGKLSDDEYDQALDKISETIIYLSETIDDFQTYFRPDKKHIDVELYDLIHRVQNFVALRVKKANIEFNVHKEKDIVAKIYSNELVQVLINIVNNAIDALLESQNESKRIMIWIEESSEYNIIKISDNAGGIAQENLEKIFEPYFSTKGKNGTGLGLYMSKMIIEKQFLGQILVDANSEETTFSIHIPKYEI